MSELQKLTLRLNESLALFFLDNSYDAEAIARELANAISYAVRDPNEVDWGLIQPNPSNRYIEARAAIDVAANDLEFLEAKCEEFNVAMGDLLRFVLRRYLGSSQYVDDHHGPMPDEEPDDDGDWWLDLLGLPEPPLSSEGGDDFGQGKRRGLDEQLRSFAISQLLRPLADAARLRMCEVLDEDLDSDQGFAEVEYWLQSRDELAEEEPDVLLGEFLSWFTPRRIRLQSLFWQNPPERHN